MNIIKGNVLLFILCSVFFAIQISLTYYNKNVWPFSGHSFFSFRPPETIYVKRIVIEGVSGEEVSGHPANFMPLEFFKANRVMLHMFMNDEVSDHDKSHFLSSIVSNAKNNPWPKFDETFSSASLSEDFVPASIRYEVEPRLYDLAKNGLSPNVSDPITQFVFHVE